MKLKYFVYAVLIVSIVLLFCYSDGYVEYRPHYRKNDYYHTRYYGDSKLTADQMSRIIQVLETYNEDYQIEGNKAVIKESLNNNWEMLWDYTTKSNDDQWLKTRFPIKQVENE